jgi:predicted O-linked N-acetylglucosamine transferase (SPINDLY family)
VGVSLLQHLGLDTLIAHSTDQYVDIASNLANDARLRRTLRPALRGRMHGARLTDTVAFVRELEAAYAFAWNEALGRRGP